MGQYGDFNVQSTIHVSRTIVLLMNEYINFKAFFFQGKVITWRRHSLSIIQTTMVHVLENYSDCFMKFCFEMKIFQRKTYII